MILADTSVWIDHFRSTNTALFNLLDEGLLLMHAHVIGELALGHLHRRETLLRYLQDLPQAPLATESEILTFIESNRLFGEGIGYSDVHIIVSARLALDTLIWTRDKRLNKVATRLGLNAAY